MFELNQLEQLVTIAKYGTLSEAAQKLYISQPALSRSMQKFEKEVGFPLFGHKKNRYMKLCNRLEELKKDWGEEICEIKKQRQQ